MDAATGHSTSAECERLAVSSRARYFVPSLESVRGLAALTVCFFHVASASYMGAPMIDPNSILMLPLNGPGAVVLFFVLSGYVLRLSLESKFSASAMAVAVGFVISRLFRVYPVAIATTGLIVVAAFLIYGRQY